jgi:hypothetical protein
MNEQLQENISNLIKSKISDDNILVLENRYADSFRETLYYAYTFIVADTETLNKIKLKPLSIPNELNKKIKLSLKINTVNENAKDYISFFTNDYAIFHKLVYSKHKEIYNKVEKAFLEIANKYKIFDKIETKDIFDKYYYLSNETYSPKIIQTKRLFYKDCYRQKKTTQKKENKSSYLETSSLLKYDVTKNKFRQKIFVKIPFLYKSKVNFEFFVDEFDFERIKNEIEETYKNIIVNHIKNKLKNSVEIDTKNFDFNNLDEYLNLIKFLIY